MPPAHLTTFVLGGARSGKSAYAEKAVKAFPPPWVYLATAQGLDDEMSQRIARHRASRGGGWDTREEPLEIAAIVRAETRPTAVDCHTLWLTNVMLAGRNVEADMARLLDAVERAQGPRVFVSNEVGLGIVPDNAMSRDFRDHAGRLNQKLAAIAGHAVFMVAGLPMVLK